MDHRTFQRSRDLPLKFLRGCGLTEDLIQQFGHKISRDDYPDCFISYSSKDEEFVTMLHADLQRAGVRCWFAPRDLPIGARVRESIDDAIKSNDRLLLILSKNAISSDWVEKEGETAFEEERNREQTVLFPIRLDRSVMDCTTAWAADIRRTRNIGDFSGWSKDSGRYRATLKRLLRDLANVA